MGNNFTGDMMGPDASEMGGGGVASGDWLGALIGLGTAIYTSEAQKSNTKRQIKANKELAEYSYAKDREMWDLMNQYNDPKAAMARYAAAGLNPNMIYGAGGSAGNASSMPSYDAPQVNIPSDYGVVDIPGALAQYQNFSMRQAQIDNVKAQTDNTNQRTANEGLRNFLLAMQGKHSETDLDQKLTTYPYLAGILDNKAQQSNWELGKAKREVAAMDQETVLRNLNIRYNTRKLDAQNLQIERDQARLLYEKQKAEWAKVGVTSSDHLLVRMMVRMLNESGLMPYGN